MDTKQFTGFLSSSANPGQLSLTVSSFTSALLSAAALYAVVNGLDSVAVVNGVQQIIDLSATAITTGLVVYHTVMTAVGVARKLWYMVAAKPVLTNSNVAATATVAPVG